MQRDPVHSSARSGYAVAADTYVRGRPDYPAGIAGWLRDTLGVRAGSTVADIGAGTGKFTARLAATGASVVAVEPVDAMRAKLTAALPGVTACAGTADAIPFADGSVDALVCAQAFHWFATPAALAQFARVLRPGGALGLVWNVRDERVDWVAALTRILAPYEAGLPRYASGAWRARFPAPGFGPLATSAFDHAHTGPPEDVIVARTLSVSFIAAQPAAERDTVAAQVRALIAATPALAGRAQVSFPYRTMAYSCRRA